METAILLLTKYGYFILFPLAAFEGPVISFIAGFLVRLGYFNFLPVLVILVLGDVIPDVIYYYIGRFGNRNQLIEKYSSRSDFVLNNFNLLEKLWRNHGRKTMLLSKLAYGLSTPLLISAGFVKMPLRRFISYTLPISILLYSFTVSIGYFLGSSYQLANKYIESAGIVVAAGIVIFIIAYSLFAKYARKQIKEMEKEEI